MTRIFSAVLTGLLIVPGAQKTTLINAGTSPILVVDEKSIEALKVLTEDAQHAVKHALYSIQPGIAKVLPTGTYTVDLGESLNASAVLMEEIPEPKKPVEKKPVVPKTEPIPVDSGNSVDTPPPAV